MNLKGLLHGQNKQETIERYIIFGVIIGVVLAGSGIALTVIQTKGATTAIALVGSFITFLFTVILVFYWVFREDK